MGYELIWKEIFGVMIVKDKKNQLNLIERTINE